MITFCKNGIGIELTEKWESDCWINIEIPTEKEKQYLLTELKIPEAFYNDIEDVDERPRIEQEDGWFLLMLRIPYKNGDEKLPFSTVPLGLIFSKDIFVSICFYKTEMITDFIAYSKRKNIIKKDNFDLALKLLLSSSIWFLKYLKQINQRIRIAEDKLEKSIRNEDLQTLLQIEKCLVYFATSIRGNDILAHKIKNLKNFRHTFDEDLVEDVDIELKQALDTTKIYSDILSGMMDAYASVISNNLNVIMKYLTSISIILMIPTLIASLYGMNVPNGMENYKYGFAVVLFISTILTIGGVLFFMRRKWF
jgi:magnesium transporter